MSDQLLDLNIREVLGVANLNGRDRKIIAIEHDRHIELDAAIGSSLSAPQARILARQLNRLALKIERREREIRFSGASPR